MPSHLDPLWDSYLEHRNLVLLKEEILTCPWYESPKKAEESLLMRAVHWNDWAAVKLLISMGESPLLPASNGFTFLHQAVDEISSAETVHQREAALAVLKALLDSGADANVLGADGTPLHRAAGSGVLDAARTLLSYGADIEARMQIDGELTPLLHAAVMGQPQMVRFLLDAGANRSAISSTSLTRPPMTLKQLLMHTNNPHSIEIMDMLN